MRSSAYGRPGDPPALVVRACILAVHLSLGMMARTAPPDSPGSGTLAGRGSRTRSLRGPPARSTPEGRSARASAGWPDPGGASPRRPQREARRASRHPAAAPAPGGLHQPAPAKQKGRRLPAFPLKTVASLEPLHAAAGVHDAVLTAGEQRVAGRADLHAKILLRRTDLVLRTARAGDRRPLVVRVNAFLHKCLTTLLVRTAGGRSTAANSSKACLDRLAPHGRNGQEFGARSPIRPPSACAPAGTVQSPPARRPQGSPPTPRGACRCACRK